MKTYSLPLKKDAKILFVCHGRAHERRAPIKLSKKHWDNGIYNDIRPETEPDFTEPIHKMAKNTYTEQFDAVLMLYCTLDAYMNLTRGEFYKRFFQNIAHWLKPGGYLVSTGLPNWAIESLGLYKFPFKLSRYEMMYLNLLDARFKEPERYATIKEKLQLENHSEKIKVLQTVESVKSYKEGDDKLTIPHKDELEIMKRFGEMIQEMTEGELVFQVSLSDLDRYIFKKEERL